MRLRLRIPVQGSGLVSACAQGFALRGSPHVVPKGATGSLWNKAELSRPLWNRIGPEAPQKSASHRNILHSTSNAVRMLRFTEALRIAGPLLMTVFTRPNYRGSSKFAITVNLCGFSHAKVPSHNYPETKQTQLQGPTR